ncbi:MAG: AI-2E family transporter [Candidatus Hydrogenedentes bacterium]|nr:AI-2E family transporter [Candidatus Hydrogenedentota bacterium]
MLNTVTHNPWVRSLGALLVVFVVAGVLYLLLPILISLMLSLLVAYILMPVVHHAEKLHIPRMVTILVLLSFVLILVVSLPVYMAANIITETDRFIIRAQEGFTEERLDAVIDKLPLRELVIFLEWVPRNTKDFNEYTVIIEKIGFAVEQNALQLIQDYGMRVADMGKLAGLSAAQFVKSISLWAIHILTVLINLGLFLFITVYLLRDYDAFMDNIHEIVPPRYRKKIEYLANKIDDQLQALLRGQITVCFFLAVMYAIGLSLVGTPFAIPIAIFGGIISLVPYIGPMVTIVPAALFTLLYYGFTSNLFWLFVVFAVIQGIEGYILTPRVVGGQIGLNPVWVIVAFLVFSSAFGMLGAVLAMPIAAVLKVVVLEGTDAYRNSTFFSAEASSPPDSSA